MCIPHLFIYIYLLMDIWVVSLLAIVNNAVWNMRAEKYMSPTFNSFVYETRMK